jgi:NADH:ubiquinone oxidoreductase subunit F (NADH-binding)
VARTAPSDLSPAELRERVLASGLRGRGGGQFPVGLKWRAVAREDGAKLVVANGAEGEPGSIKDRYVMTARPAEVLEGLALAARAVGASKGIVYLKGSFAAAAAALERARAASDFGGLRIEIRLGEDSYIVGEETALLESLEGRRAWPRPKPPYPAAVGYQGRPTLVQNVETLARVPAAVSDPDAFRAGPPCLVSLWGHVARPGVYEVPLGTPLRTLIDEKGGGAPDGVSLVFPAGPSAAPLSAERLDTPLEAEALVAAGSALGTASVLVVGASCDALSVLDSLAAFFERESCGQCPPCTVGTATLHRIVGAAASGAARSKDFSDFGEAAFFMKDHGYCAHCPTAAASVGALLERCRGREPAGRACRPFDPDSPERRAVEAEAATFR